jgi:hypothetical protein
MTLVVCVIAVTFFLGSNMKFLPIIISPVLATTLDDFTLLGGVDSPADILGIFEVSDSPDPSQELADELVSYGGLYSSRTSRNRVPMHATRRQLLNNTRFIVDRYAQQIIDDESNDEFTPQLEFDSIRERTPLGNFTLGDPIARGFSFIDFAVEEDPKITIRYSHDCFAMPFTPVIHPVVHDAFYGEEAHLADVGLAYHFVSPSAALPWNRISRKLQFAMTDSVYFSCLFAEGTVRYTIHDRPDQSLWDFIDKQADHKLDFRFAMEVGTTLIRMIQAIHNRGFVHGDIAVDRITVSKISDDDFQLSLVNFKFASVINTGTGLALEPWTKDPTKPGSIIYSPRELSGLKTYGTHDDVFRIVEVIAMSVRGPRQYRQNLHARFRNGTLLAWKSEADLFGDLADVPLASREDIRTRLGELVAIARRVDTPVPDYENIVRLLNEVGILAAGVLESTTSPTIIENQTQNTRKRPRGSP